MTNHLPNSNSSQVAHFPSQFRYSVTKWRFLTAPAEPCRCLQAPRWSAAVSVGSAAALRPECVTGTPQPQPLENQSNRPQTRKGPSPLEVAAHESHESHEFFASSPFVSFVGFAGKIPRQPQHVLAPTAGQLRQKLSLTPTSDFRPPPSGSWTHVSNLLGQKKAKSVNSEHPARGAAGTCLVSPAQEVPGICIGTSYTGELAFMHRHTALLSRKPKLTEREENFACIFS
jgi:hypothetical protein